MSSRNCISTVTGLLHKQWPACSDRSLGRILLQQALTLSLFAHPLCSGYPHTHTSLLSFLLCLLLHLPEKTALLGSDCRPCGCVSDTATAKDGGYSGVTHSRRDGVFAWRVPLYGADSLGVTDVPKKMQCVLSTCPCSGDKRAWSTQRSG